MRLLVTGAGGFIGRRLVSALAPAHDLTCLSRVAPTVPDVRWIRSDDQLGMESWEGDAVLHLAGNSNHAAGIDEDVAATVGFAARVLGTVSAPRLVILSSAAVYAGLEGPTDPHACLNPTMPYALSKLHTEGLARHLQGQGRFGSLMILRLYNAFGPGERDVRLMPRIEAAGREGNPFTLTGDPHSLSDPVHVDDVVRSLLAAAASSIEGAFDVCGGEAIGLADRVRRIAKLLGHEQLEIRLSPRPGEVPIRFFGNPGRLTSGLGIPGPEPFDEAMLRYAREVGWLSA